MRATGEAPAVVCHGQHATTFLTHAGALTRMHGFIAYFYLCLLTFALCSTRKHPMRERESPCSNVAWWSHTHKVRIFVGVAPPESR